MPEQQTEAQKQYLIVKYFMQILVGVCVIAIVGLVNWGMSVTDKLKGITDRQDAQQHEMNDTEGDVKDLQVLSEGLRDVFNKNLQETKYEMNSRIIHLEDWNTFNKQLK